MRNPLIWSGLLLLVVAVPATAFRGAQQTADSQQSEVEFTLNERSVFEIRDDSIRRILARGASVICQEQPHAAVKAYPELRSKKPIYGVLQLAPDQDGQQSGTAVYFVIDESGETPAAGAQAEEQPAESPSLLETLSTRLFGRRDARVAEAPPELENTYDRLHIDLNGDLDLTNDPIVVPRKAPPPDAVPRYSGLRQAVVFEDIALAMDFGPELGDRPVRLLPRLLIREHEGREYHTVQFMMPVVREGDIALGNQPYRAVLAQCYAIAGRYDSPHTQLFLTPRGRPEAREDWWGAEQLNALRLADGRYYATSTTPLGDRLTVHPYRGDLGTLKIGPGDRGISRLSIRGSLQSANTAVAVGKPRNGGAGQLEAVAQCQLPVGDYIPSYVTVEYGRLRLSISQNYHSDGKPRDVDRTKWKYGIQIRKQKPFVWDFSNPPEVMFASPGRDQTFKRGDQVAVMAVLIDPELTIMIRGLVDMERKETKTYDLGDGRTGSYETNVSLDPKVVITNATGRQVAEGLMPFG